MKERKKDGRNEDKKEDKIQVKQIEMKIEKSRRIKKNERRRKIMTGGNSR